MVVDIFYPNDDRPERPQRPVESILDDVETYLKENTRPGEPIYTIDQIAEEQGLENFREELVHNRPLQEALEKFIDLNELGAFTVYENRADANFLALLFSQVQKEDTPK